MIDGACLDSSILMKIITPEEGSTEASLLAGSAHPLYAPAFAWAEVGSTLRKKVRSGALDREAAEGAWGAFGELGLRFIQSPEVARRAWELAHALALSTLYDAAFLAVAELAPEGPVPFWTADLALVRQVGERHPLIRPLIA